MGMGMGTSLVPIEIGTKSPFIKWGEVGDEVFAPWRPAKFQFMYPIYIYTNSQIYFDNNTQWNQVDSKYSQYMVD